MFRCTTDTISIMSNVENADKKTPTLEKILMHSLNTQRGAGKFCDVRLTIGEQFTWIHSSVICSVSPYIDKECCNALGIQTKYKSEAFHLKSPLTIRIDKTDNFKCFECLLVLIDIIYGQNVQIDSIHFSHVISLCKLLSVSEVIIKIIRNVLQYNIDPCDREIIDQQPPNLINSVTTDIPVKRKEKVTNLLFKLSSVPSKEKRRRNVIRTRKHVEFSESKALSGKMQSCIECQHKCYKPFDLISHLRDTGHSEKVCSLCFIKMDSVEKMYEHYKSHDNPKPFYCTFCDARFQTRTLLSQHLPRHSTETPYMCHHCKKGFKWKHGLNSHLITHSKEKKHLCDECGFSTTHAKTLRAHKLNHTGELFRCSHPGCVHTSSRKENMKIHLATHNKDKPFVCEICGHKFTQSKGLKRHALIHSGSVLLNICPHCPFKALRTDNLKAHIIRHHTEKPLILELSDHFAESEFIDSDLPKTSQTDELDSLTNFRKENDLSVLADAASSCKKLSNPATAKVRCQKRDNLIANPMLRNTADDELIKIEDMDMILFDDSGIPIHDSNFA